MFQKFISHFTYILSFSFKSSLVCDLLVFYFLDFSSYSFYLLYTLCFKHIYKCVSLLTLSYVAFIEIVFLFLFHFFRVLDDSTTLSDVRGPLRFIPSRVETLSCLKSKVTTVQLDPDMIIRFCRLIRFKQQCDDGL